MTVLPFSVAGAFVVATGPIAHEGLIPSHLLADWIGGNIAELTARVDAHVVFLVRVDKPPEGVVNFSSLCFLLVDFFALCLRKVFSFTFFYTGVPPLAQIPLT